MFKNNMTARNLAVLLAATSTAALLIQSSAQSAGIAASTSVTNTSLPNDVKLLREQLLVLESRIKKLEDAADSIGGSDEEDAKRLEQRLANIERQQAKLEAKGKESDKADASDRPESLTVVAPFTVVDEDGKPIMRVSVDDGTFSRGVYAFNEGGASVAHLGSSAFGGRMYVSRPGKLPEAYLGVIDKGSQLKVGSSGSNAALMLKPDDLTFLSDGNSVLALFGTRNRNKGYLELNDSSGSKMVEAGMLENHKGYVLASPYHTSVDPHGDPSVLKGGGK